MFWFEKNIKINYKRGGGGGGRRRRIQEECKVQLGLGGIGWYWVNIYARPTRAHNTLRIRGEDDNWSVN